MKTFKITIIGSDATFNLSRDSKCPTVCMSTVLRQYKMNVDRIKYIEIKSDAKRLEFSRETGVGGGGSGKSN